MLACIITHLWRAQNKDRETHWQPHLLLSWVLCLWTVCAHCGLSLPTQLKGHFCRAIVVLFLWIILTNTTDNQRNSYRACTLPFHHWKNSKAKGVLELCTADRRGCHWTGDLTKGSMPGDTVPSCPVFIKHGAIILLASSHSMSPHWHLKEVFVCYS